MAWAGLRVPEKATEASEVHSAKLQIVGANVVQHGVTAVCDDHEASEWPAFGLSFSKEVIGKVRSTMSGLC